MRVRVASHDATIMHDVCRGFVPVFRPVRRQNGRRVADEAVDAAGRPQLVQEARHVVRQSHDRSHFELLLLSLFSRYSSLQSQSQVEVNSGIHYFLVLQKST